MKNSIDFIYKELAIIRGQKVSNLVDFVWKDKKFDSVEIDSLNKREQELERELDILIKNVE